MMYELKFDPSADKTIRKWKKSNPNLYKKLGKILHELIDHPRTGTGHPEALKGGNNITYSRHIIYDHIVTVLVVDIEGHYNDK